MTYVVPPWETLHNKIINISKIHWSFTKVQILSHATTDKWRDTQMNNNIHSMAPT